MAAQRDTAPGSTGKGPAFQPCPQRWGCNRTPSTAPSKGRQTLLCCWSRAQAQQSFGPAALLVAAHVEAASRAVGTFPGAGRQPGPAPPSCLWPIAHTEELEIIPHRGRRVPLLSVTPLRRSWVAAMSQRITQGWPQGAASTPPIPCDLRFLIILTQPASPRLCQHTVKPAGNQGGNPGGREPRCCSRGCRSRWAGEGAAAAAAAGSNTPAWSRVPAPVHSLRCILDHPVPSGLG